MQPRDPFQRVRSTTGNLVQLLLAARRPELARKVIGRAIQLG